jgi:hypothetical protein
LKRDTARVHFAWVVLGGTAVALLAASGVLSIKPMDAVAAAAGS